MMGHIELDIKALEEIFAENRGNAVPEIMLAGDKHPPILAHGLADPEFIDEGCFNVGLAAHAEHPIAPGPLSGEAQTHGRRPQDDGPRRASVQHHTDSLPVDGAVDDEMVAFQPNWPLRNLSELAVGRTGGVAGHGNAHGRHGRETDARPDQW
jgi:hypothetical protein